jgi:hypothetical protein
MAKIITNPLDCRHRHPAGACIHSKTTVLDCSVDKFPPHCPLQEGISMKDHLDSVLDLKRRQDNSEKSSETLKSVKRMQAREQIAEKERKYNDLCARSTLYPGKSIEEVEQILDNQETKNIPVLSPIFWYCSYCKAWIFVKDQSEVDNHVSMVHGVSVNIPPCKLG